LNFFEADRAYIFKAEEDGRLSNIYEVCAKGIIPQIDKLQQMDSHYIDRWIGAFKAKQVFLQEDIETIKDSDPSEYELMKKQGISRYIEAPILAGGKFLGFLGVDNPERAKMLHSSELLLSFAYGLANALLKDRTERQFENHSRELETILQKLPIGLSVTRFKDGKIVSRTLNPLFAELSGIAPETWDGDLHAFLSKIPSVERGLIEQKTAEGALKPVSFRQIFPFQLNPDGPIRYYQWDYSSSLLHDEILVLSALSDVTSEKENEAKIKRSRQMYETAAELAHISVWIYDIPSHRIFLSSNTATTTDREAYDIPKTIENVPESLSAWIAPKDFTKACNMYRQTVNGATLNFRDAAPLCAGLLFGAPAGIIAGVIGGVERFFAVYWGAGTFTQIACSISTVIAGLAGAAFRKWMFDDKKPSWFYALAISLVAEVIHMLMIFLTNMGEVTRAFEVVERIALWMILGNVIIVTGSTIAISLFGREKIFPVNEQKRLAQSFQRWLLLDVLVAFFSPRHLLM